MKSHRAVKLRLLPNKIAAAHGMMYLDRLPPAIPSGVALVHNSVRPTRRLGTRGFRAWLQKPNDRLASCDCGFAPELGQHFCIAKVKELTS